MITGKDIYSVLSALVPLYVAMILAYGSVRWWKIFSPQQCAGINRFVAVFAVPLLSFHFISSNNPYSMNYQFIAADSLQKIVVLVALFLWQAITKNGNLEWMITLFSLSTLPNTLVMGIPLLKAMYGDFSGDLMVQIVVLQSIIWYTLMLLMFEYRGAKLLISEQFPETAASIVSFKVDSDVVSLNGREPLMADAEIGEDGKLHVVVRRSSASSMASSFNKSNGFNSLTSITPRASNLTGVEIYSVQSSREPTPRASSFNQTDFYAMFSSKVSSPKNGGTPRNSNFEDETTVKNAKKKGSGGRSISEEMVSFNGDSSVSPTSNPSGGLKKIGSGGGGGVGGGVTSNKEHHMFVWSSSPSPATTDCRSSSKPALQPDSAIATQEKGEKRKDIEEGSNHEVNASPYGRKKVAGIEDVDIDGDQKTRQMPPASVMTRLILIMVWRKLIRNPNTYSSLIGLAWSLISFKWHIEMPLIIKGSISILSDAGLGMAMFSLGLFMALQPKIIACGKSVAIFSMAVRFLTGPAVIAATSIAVGLRGVLLHVAIVQAALPQGIVPFVFAKEYNVHPDILSTAVIFGMLIALPITILYYVVLGV